jgi:glycerol-3-phosphate acyltransferase PlsX
VRIAVDALGGDNAPDEVVAGAVEAARELSGHEIILVGDRDSLRLLAGANAPENVSARESGGVVGMAEDPVAALRDRPDASIAVAARMVREGEADALFSAGSTGATVTAALLRIGRLEGCRRPAIGTVLPFTKPALLLDVGATVACRPRDLFNFAILGGVFAERYFGLEEKARVGLINIGEEPGKGTDLVKDAHGLMSRSGEVRFAGNVEGRDIGSGAADVLVTDGFTGNVLLKTAEGITTELFGMLRSAMTATATSRLAAAVLKPRLQAVRDTLDPESYGGSFLLGVRGAVVIGHGNARRQGVRSAITGITRAGGGLLGDLENALSLAGKEVG